MIPDLGIELGRCNRDVIGAVIGGVAGGVVGSQVGRGSERTVATIGGAIARVLIGGAIGRSMDQADQACIPQTLEQAPAQHAVAWSNPDGGHYRVVPLEGYEDGQGRICRDYRTTATIRGGQQQLYGTACRQPDGTLAAGKLRPRRTAAAIRNAMVCSGVFTEEKGRNQLRGTHSRCCDP